jgi:PASTA domain
MWDDGRRAWERLDGWGEDRRPDGDALAALSDIGLVRRLLDEAELAAVRTARGQRRSWAEIATKLGVTRQSAWERWRDLDEPPPPTQLAPPGGAGAAAGAAPGAPGAGGAGGTGAPGGAGAAAGAAPGDATVGGAAREAVARQRRRQSTITVPSVLGMSWSEALGRLTAIGLVAVGPDPDESPTLRERGVITDQSPEAGARVPAGSVVTLWLDRGGGSGVREPRRPHPRPRSGRALPPEDAAVS